MFSSATVVISGERSWNSRSWTGHPNIMRSSDDPHFRVSWQFLTTCNILGFQVTKKEATDVCIAFIHRKSRKTFALLIKTSKVALAMRWKYLNISK
jgi:hypothetical protein